MSDIDYTKWPRLLVRGQNVAPDQAEEMILRTTNWFSLFSNDKAFLASVFRAVGLEPEPDHGAPVETRMAWIAKADDFREQFGPRLSLHYLGLSDRIVSAHIGGPHGWVDWDGSVGSSDYDIGKWPDQVELEEDVAALAGAFPWLSADFQLITDEGEGRIADTWSVEGGSWRRRHDITERLVEPAEFDAGGLVSLLAFHSSVTGRERGITPASLKAAADRLRTRLRGAL